MPAHAVYIVLFAALMHAGWNAIVKGGGDKLLSAVLITSAAALIAAVVLPFLAPPARVSWPFIAASVALQILYYALLAAAYRGGDLSHAYPIMRGTAPLMVAAVSAWLIGEPVTVARWLGIGLICAGVLGLPRTGPRTTGRTARIRRIPGMPNRPRGIVPSLRSRSPMPS